MSITKNHNDVAATAPITKKTAPRTPAVKNEVTFDANGIKVSGRGLQVLGNKVKNATTRKEWNLNWAVLSAVLQGSDASVGQIGESLVAAGLTAVDIQFYMTGAKTTYKPNFDRFAKKA